MFLLKDVIFECTKANSAFLACWYILTDFFVYQEFMTSSFTFQQTGELVAITLTSTVHKLLTASGLSIKIIFPFLASTWTGIQG